MACGRRGRLAALALLFVLAGVAVAAEPGALPPDCLAAGVLEGADALTDRAGALLGALDGRTDAADLRRRLGALLGNPRLAGVDLAAPIRFYYMDPKKYASPWVYQYQAANPDALKWALLAHARRYPFGALRLDGARATWSADPALVEALRAWQADHPEALDLRVSGPLRVRIALARILAAYPDEFTRQLREMKSRMEQALEGRSAGGTEALASQIALEMAATVLRQVGDVDVGVGLDASFTRVDLHITALPGTALAGTLQTQPAGDVALLRQCPGGAAVAAAYSTALVEAARSLVLQTMGLGMLVRRTAAPRGERVTALFLPAAPGQPIELLDIAAGDSAAQARRQWDQLGQGGSPFIPVLLRALPDDAAAPGLRQAELLPNEATLGEGGVRLFRRFLGPKPLAAQQSREGRTVSAVGPAPIERLRQVDALTERDALPAMPAFRASVGGLPEKPGVLLYVAPDGVRRWLTLGGMTPASGSESLGLAAAARIDGAGVHATLNLPTGAIPVPQRP